MPVTLNSVYNEVAFTEKSAITKENLCTKYLPLAYNTLNCTYNEKKYAEVFLRYSRFFVIGDFVIGRVECTLPLIKSHL